MPDSKRTLYLLDAMALAYRAHFIFINRPLINSRGFNTSATYGFTSALVKLIEDHGINHMAVVFDVMEPGGTFRDEMYEDYKGHRDPPPEELIANLPHMKRVVEAMLMGRAVTLAPQSMTLTTQQAADLLGVSRPTVVRLISDNQIAADRVGNRHRLQLDDVLAYKESRRARQYDALSETSVSVDAGEDPDLIREQLREARKAVAARRRAGTRA